VSGNGLSPDDLAELSRIKADIARLKLQFLNGTLTKEEARAQLAEIETRLHDVVDR
jgi:Zn-dependent oligopeptidase